MTDMTTALNTVSVTRSPENRLQDHVDRVEHALDGHCAVILNLAQMGPGNRKPHHILIARHYVYQLLNAANVQIYNLTFGDLVLVCKGLPVDEMDDAINKVRHLFKLDPLTRTDIDKKHDKFASWYDFEVGYGVFEELTAKLCAVSGELSQKP